MRAFKRRTWRYLMPALLFAVAINVPKFLEFKNIITPDNRTYIEPTKMRMDDEYQGRNSDFCSTGLDSLAKRDLYGLLPTL